MNWARLWQLMLKEFRQMFRDPRSTRIMFASPIVQLLLFGYAVNTDVRHARTFVVDHDRTSASRQLVSTLTASGYFRVTGYGERPDDLAYALDHGDAVIGLEIPEGFAADIAGGRQAQVQVAVGTTAATVHQGRLGREIGFVDQGVHRQVRQPVGQGQVGIA